VIPGTRTEADAISAIAKTGGAQTDLWTDLNASEDNVKTRLHRARQCLRDLLRVERG